MKQELGAQVVYFLRDVAAIDTRIVFLVLLLVISVMVLDAVFGGARKAKKDSGINDNASAVSIDGSKTVPLRDYVSEMQGLAGRPDALISEDGHIIPVERKPLAKKIRDRHVAQLLVYMRLVEEFEGKKPPYGYLILGANCRRVRIDNTEERQAWLQGIIDQMRGILNGAAAVATPHPKKCRKCYVKESCAFREDTVDAIQSRSPSLAKSA